MDKENTKMQAKLQRFAEMDKAYDIINFKGRTLIRAGKNKPYVPLTSDEFASLAYRLMPGLLITQIRELEHKFRAEATDHTQYAHLVAMGKKSWDSNTLELVPRTGNEVMGATVTPADVTRKNYTKTAAWQYMLELAVGDPDLAWDMVQGLAPLFMAKKPAGVIWFIGEGANGKSALMNAIYKIIGTHLCSLTVGAIEDGRDTPRLNGLLGNVCRESSEGKVEDSERYKALGTHEPFEVHKFHSQDAITIQGDIHHIFNANNIPIFNDKTMGARRRTLIIPFPARFEDNPLFEEQTFTPQFLGELLGLIFIATHIIRDNGYKYRFGDATKDAKNDYDAEVNSAEAFLKHLRKNNVKAFTNYRMLKVSYEGWCATEGYVPLGITNLKRVMRVKALVERRTIRRDDGTFDKWYFLDPTEDETLQPKDLVELANGLQVDILAPKEIIALTTEEKEQLNLLNAGW